MWHLRKKKEGCGIRRVLPEERAWHLSQGKKRGWHLSEGRGAWHLIVKGGVASGCEEGEQRAVS